MMVHSRSEKFPVIVVSMNLKFLRVFYKQDVFICTQHVMVLLTNLVGTNSEDNLFNFKVLAGNKFYDYINKDFFAVS